MAYQVFTRTWWKRNPDWPDGREPCMGKKRYITTVSTQQEAKELCKQYNETHKPGFLSRKAEFEEI